MTWQTSLELYEEGALTERELTWRLWQFLTEETIKDFVQNCPKDVLDNLIAEAEKWPHTDEEWKRMRVFCTGSWVGYAKESYERELERQKQDWRRGVETLRRYMEKENEQMFSWEFQHKEFMMFGHAMHQYMKGKYGNLPEVEVTRDELIQLHMEHGKTRAEAEFQVNTVMCGLGADLVMIGDKKYKLKEEKPDGAQDHTS